MTVLAIDIGNSTTVLGLYRERKIVADWRFPTDPSLPAAVIGEHLRLFLSESGIAPGGIDAAGIASVVPPLTRKLASRVRALTQTIPVVISGMRSGRIRMHYRNPQKLGADRVCAIAAAWERYGGPAIIVDFGSATTIDALSGRGEYLGGIIAPGVGLQIDALASRTAQLPAVPPAFPPSVIGRTTVECIQSGVLYGTVAMLEGIVGRMNTVLGRGTRVIATGGYAALIAGKSRAISHIDPWLVLDGVRILSTSAVKGAPGGGRRSRHASGR